MSHQKRFAIAFILSAFIPLAAAAQDCPTESNPDLLSSIQQAFNTKGVANVRPGTYTITDAIQVPKNCRLYLNGATINVDYDGPGIVLGGNRARVVGDEAKIVALTEHAGPIVRVTSGLRFVVEDVWITGKGKSQIGLQIDDISPTESTFFGIVRDVQINNVDVGILVSENANGNEIYSPLIWQANSSFIRFRGAYANRVIGGFAHGAGATDGVVAVELISGTLNGKPVGSTHNQIIGFSAEPGGTSSSPYTIDSLSTDNQIVAQLNMKGPPVNHGQHNWGVRRGDREVTSINTPASSAVNTASAQMPANGERKQTVPVQRPAPTAPAPSKAPVRRTLFEILRDL